MNKRPRKRRISKRKRPRNSLKNRDIPKIGTGGVDPRTKSAEDFPRTKSAEDFQVYLWYKIPAKRLVGKARCPPEADPSWGAGLFFCWAISGSSSGDRRLFATANLPRAWPTARFDPWYSFFKQEEVFDRKYCVLQINPCLKRRKIRKIRFYTETI